MNQAKTEALISKSDNLSGTICVDIVDEVNCERFRNDMFLKYQSSKRKIYVGTVDLMYNQILGNNTENILKKLKGT